MKLEKRKACTLTGRATACLSATLALASVACRTGLGDGPSEADDTPPSVVEATVAPSAAGADSVVSLVVAFDEDLAEAPTLDWDGADPQMSLDAFSGRQAIYTLDVDASGVADGTYTLASLASEDTSGNQGTFELTPPLSFEVDASDPVLTNLAVTPASGRANDQDTVTATFDVTDSNLDSSSVTATLDGDPMTCTQGAGTSWSCSLQPTPPSPPAESAATVLIRAEDTFGNSATASDSIVLDFVPPAVAAASIVYIGDQTNPLPNPTQAKDLTTILVTVSFTETLDAVAFPPELEASLGSESLPFTLQTNPADITTSATFSVVVGTQPGGVYAPAVSAQDVAGNRTTSAGFPASSDPIVVDNTADSLVVQQDQVSFIRSPIGNADAEDLEDSNGNVTYTIPSGVAFYALGPPDGLDPVDALDADTFELSGGVQPTLLRAWADDQTQNLLGTTVPDSQGDWPRSDLQLVNLDTPQVYVTGLDEAGNESDPVLVENAWYVGSTAQPALGAGPHTTGFSSRPLAPLQARSAPSFPSRAESPDAQAEIARAERAWRERSDRQSPPARDGHALAYDSARGRVVLFGGRDSSNNRLSDTWEWDGTSWTDVTPSGATASPPARERHALAYDSDRGRVVLFGGQDSLSNRLSDTWEWDGTGWTDVTPPGVGASPPARFGHALAYDSARGRVVLFGGDRFTNRLSDTWEWDGTAWTDVTPTGASPPARRGHALAYDSDRGRVVLFGGRDGSFTFLSDTWEWDGTAWTDVTPAGANASPPARAFHALAYDTARGRVVLFGGCCDSSFNRLSDTWAWNGTAWTDVTPAGASPPARTRHALAYDSARGRVVLFGGSGSTALSETWESEAPTVPDGQLTLQLPPGMDRDAISDIRVRAFCGGRYEDASGNPADGAQLLGWVTGGAGKPPGAYEVLATNTTAISIPSGSSGLMDYQPAASAAADVAQGFFGPERRMVFQCRPDGPSGSGFAEVALDYMEVRVKYDTTP